MSCCDPLNARGRAESTGTLSCVKATADHAQSGADYVKDIEAYFNRSLCMSNKERSSSTTHKSAGQAKKPAPANVSPTKETESVSEETVRKEESPRESSIEREIHPERKP